MLSCFEIYEIFVKKNEDLEQFLPFRQGGVKITFDFQHATRI